MEFYSKPYAPFFFGQIEIFSPFRSSEIYTSVSLSYCADGCVTCVVEYFELQTSSSDKNAEYFQTEMMLAVVLWTCGVAGSPHACA